ncbi:hydroxymethylglutaryl-coenzyme A reductase [Aureococcus anophagefferens]|nr:hydroxymethylglutaryl-coenzyme A reductase [Aureococcus anophagefferens]
MPVANSRLAGFHKLTVAERRAAVAEAASLSEGDVAALAREGELPLAVADRMIENVIGTYSLPVGVATNFVIDGRHYLIPFVLEEASVVAAASNMAKRCLKKGGFTSECDAPVMIGQIEVRGCAHPGGGGRRRRGAGRRRKEMRRRDAEHGGAGGGFRGLEARVVDGPGGPLVVCHLLVDCRDAMGANLVNTLAEALSDYVASLCGAGSRAGLRILSNLATERLARVSATFTPGELAATADEGATVVDAILEAFDFARADPWRACTNNKGVMNAISSVAVATGQDWRAIEAGAHAYVGYGTSYGPMTAWSKNDDGDLVGSITVPMAVGLVGGACKVHPAAKANLNILGVDKAVDLAKVMAAAGLAQNLAALKALATEGIQRGHMALHARSRGDQA